MMSATRKSSQEKLLSQNDFIFPKTTSRIRKTSKVEDTQKIFKYIDDSVTGKGNLFLGPAGRRKGKHQGSFFVHARKKMKKVFNVIALCLELHKFKFNSKNAILSIQVKIAIFQKFLNTRQLKVFHLYRKFSITHLLKVLKFTQNVQRRVDVIGVIKSHKLNRNFLLRVM